MHFEGPKEADERLSQILVEFDFPPSGLSGLEDAVPLPLVPDSGTDPHRRDQQFFFLAVIAMRRLLNRIHFHLYNQGWTSDVTLLLSVANIGVEEVVAPSPSVMMELKRQIEEWRACLPPALKFDDLSLLEELQTQTALPGSIRSMQERMKGNLKARYHAAWTILYRSHLHHAVHTPDPSTLSDDEVGGARTAINSAITGILHGGIMHEPLELLLFPMNSWRTYVEIIPNSTKLFEGKRANTNDQAFLRPRLYSSSFSASRTVTSQRPCSCQAGKQCTRCGILLSRRRPPTRRRSPKTTRFCSCSSGRGKQIYSFGTSKVLAIAVDLKFVLCREAQ